MDDLQKDTRLLRRNLAKGFISQDAVDEMLKTLPDVADHAEWIDIEDDLDDDDGADADED
jgi:Ca2+-binding EF-hand superfamily protein